jgi:nicotinate-nucleotide adenylyltransferase
MPIMNPTNKTVALFFGTFNPIHIGHLIIADYVAQNQELDQVWLVVSPHNPLKKRENLLEDHHRLRLVREAIYDNPRLQASSIEFDLPKPSYTIDTLTYLSEKYPNYRFRLIIGEDNMRNLSKWKNYKQLLNQYGLIVYPRNQLPEEKISLPNEDLQWRDYPNITLCKDVPLMDISASFIRRQIKEGKSVEYLLSSPVAKYIREMHFYEK